MSSTMRVGGDACAGVRVPATEMSAGASIIGISTIQMSKSPARSEWKAMWRPSADQVGCASIAVSEVRRCSPPSESERM